MLTSITTTVIPAPTLPTPSVDLVQAAQRSDDLPAEWTPADIDRALLRYRRFLALVAASPRTQIAPTRDIDVMWHLHMLSPRAYHADCMRWFGDVLDHNGGFGKAPEEEPILIAAFDRTARRYESMFGEKYAERTDVIDCWHDCDGRCWHACSNELDGAN